MGIKVGPAPIRALLLAGLACGAGLLGGVSTAAAETVHPIGAHSMLQLNDPPSFMAAMFAQASAMHASAIRLDVAPSIVFPGSLGAPDFTGLDEVVSLAQTYHLRVLGDLFTIPDWMADCAVPTDSVDVDRCAPGSEAQYASAISQIVTRADPVIRDWEIWNEPDTGAYFDGTPQQYALMLRTAHDAIKAVDPAADVLFGGISGTASMSWLAQVFATPGADAAHAFDTADIHERADLWQLAPDIAAWKRFLISFGFSGPLWVTEHGYPGAAAYQYDPGYVGGETAQASYLAASIPTLVDAGAEEVFVTERDNLGGQFASEGVLGGDVSDPPAPDPQVVRKPAFAVVRGIADCYLASARGCPGQPPVVSPTAVALPATEPRRSSSVTVTVSEPGGTPAMLGAATLTGAATSAGGPAGALSLQSDGCSGQILEPVQTCTMSVQFKPSTGGVIGATLTLPTDAGSLSVPVTAVSPSVSNLLVPASLPFSPRHGADGVGYPQTLSLALTNPLSAAVAIDRVAVSGPDAGRFTVTSDRCAAAELGAAELGAAARCELSLRFDPRRAGVTRGVLEVFGTGLPLSIGLRAVAFSLPRITRVKALGAGRGAVLSPRHPVLVDADQPATVHWSLALAGSARRRAVAAGQVPTSRRPVLAAGRRGYAVRILPRTASLPAGVYALTTSAVDRHGAGPARVTALRLR
jgi:hypothetical protein